MKVELEGLRKHLKNSKIIAFPKEKKAISKKTYLCRLL